MKTTLTDTQKKALKMMDDRRLGAICLRGEYVWPCDIRENETIAQAVIEFIEHREKNPGLYW